MTDTGIDASCLVAYNSFKQNRDKRYIIFRLNDYNQVIVASEGGRDKTYTDFMDAIRDQREPAYGVVDFKLEGSDEEKTLLFFWVPESDSRKRIFLTSMKEAMLSSLEGIDEVIDASFIEDLLPVLVAKDLQE